MFMNSSAHKWMVLDFWSCYIQPVRWRNEMRERKISACFLWNHGDGEVFSGVCTSHVRLLSRMKPSDGRIFLSVTSHLIWRSTSARHVITAGTEMYARWAMPMTVVYENVEYLELLWNLGCGLVEPHGRSTHLHLPGYEFVALVVKGSSGMNLYS